MSRRRAGHTNVYNLDELKPYPTNPERVSIPIMGGAQVDTVKRLPDLSLDKKEWEEIGQEAGWLNKMSGKSYLLDTDRWIGQFNEAYHKIIKLGDNHILDRANEVLCPALDQLEIILREAARARVGICRFADELEGVLGAGDEK